MAASATASAALFLGMHAVISYRLRYALVLCIAALCAIATASPAQDGGARSTVPEIALDGSVGPATADFVIDEIETANKRNTPFVILRIDTPGGLVSSMREIVQSILASSVPVIGYVAPEGARVHSAGSHPGTLNPMAVRVMSEVGIDLSGHHSKSVDDVPLERVGVVVTLCSEEVCPTLPGTVERLHWPFEDPAAETGGEEAALEAFRTARDGIEKRVRELFGRPA